jgi:hypothetical protein
MAETKLEFTGDTAQAQREYDKLVKKNAQLREEVRKTGEQSKKTTDAWSIGMDRMVQQTDKWSHGVAKLNEQLKRLREGQFGAFKNIAGTTGGGMGGGWGSGLVKLKEQTDGYAAGLNKLKAAQDAVVKRKSDHLQLMDLHVAKMSPLLSSSLQYISALGGISAALAVVGAGVAVTINAYERWSSKVKQLSEDHRRLTKDIIDNSMASGNVANAGAVESFAQAGGRATSAQRLAALSGVQGAIPLAGFGRQSAIAGAVAGMAPAMRDPEALRQFGTLAGQVGDIMPGAAAGDVADVATVLKSRAGGNLDKLGGDKFQAAMKRMIATGSTPAQAMGTALAAVDANISSSTMTGLAGIVSAAPESLMPSRGERGAMAADERRLAQASGAERIEILRNNQPLAEKVLGKDGAVELRRLTPENIAAGAKAIEQAQTGNAAEGVVAGLGASSAGRGQRAEQAIAVSNERAQSVRARNKAMRSQVHEFGRSQYEGSGFISESVMGGVSRSMEAAEDVDRAFWNDAQLGKENKTLEVIVSRISTALEKNTSATNQNTNRQPGRNIDAHTE